MKTLDTKTLRLMVMEALDGMKQCSECGAMYESGDVHECGMYEGEKDEDELDEFSGGAAGAVAGYTLPLGMRPPGPRRDVVDVARRSFGGSGKRKKRKSR